MVRSLAGLLVAAFIATAGAAIADPQYNASNLPTLSVFNRTGKTVKVEFIENGAVKRNLTLYRTTSYVPVHLQGSFTMTGSVDVDGKWVAITSRHGVVLALRSSINISVESSGSGFIFKNGP